MRLYDFMFFAESSKRKPKKENRSRVGCVSTCLGLFAESSQRKPKRQTVELDVSLRFYVLVLKGLSESQQTQIVGLDQSLRFVVYFAVERLSENRQM